MLSTRLCARLPGCRLNISGQIRMGHTSLPPLRIGTVETLGAGESGTGAARTARGSSLWPVDEGSWIGSSPSRFLAPAISRTNLAGPLGMVHCHSLQALASLSSDVVCRSKLHQNRVSILLRTDSSKMGKIFLSSLSLANQPLVWQGCQVPNPWAPVARRTAQ